MVNQPRMLTDNYLSTSGASGQISPAVFSSMGMVLSSLSGILISYQQYSSAAILYLVALLCHGIQKLIRTASNQKSHVVKIYDRLMLHLSNLVVISLIVTSQMSSPLPGMILALILVAQSIRKYRHNLYYY